MQNYDRWQNVIWKAKTNQSLTFIHWLTHTKKRMGHHSRPMSHSIIKRKAAVLTFWRTGFHKSLCFLFFSCFLLLSLLFNLKFDTDFLVTGYGLWTTTTAKATYVWDDDSHRATLQDYKYLAHAPTLPSQSARSSVCTLNTAGIKAFTSSQTGRRKARQAQQPGSRFLSRHNKVGPCPKGLGWQPNTSCCILCKVILSGCPHENVLSVADACPLLSPVEALALFHTNVVVNTEAEVIDLMADIRSLRPYRIHCVWETVDDWKWNEKATRTVTARPVGIVSALHITPDSVIIISNNSITGKEQRWYGKALELDTTD